MKVLLDHNIPVQLRQLLLEHSVFTAREMLWDRLQNGDLLKIAEENSFDVMVTGDKNLSYQQNSKNRTLSLVVLSQIKLQNVVLHARSILDAISRASPGSYELVTIPPLTPQTPAVE